MIVGKMGSGGFMSGAGWSVFIEKVIETNHLGTMVQQSGGSTWYSKYSTALYNDGKWHHVVFVLSGGNTITNYIDGSSSNANNDQSSGTVSSFSNTSNVRIGNDYDGEYFNGNVDDVRIYSTALTASEVSNLYNYGTTYSPALDTGSAYTLAGSWQNN